MQCNEWQQQRQKQQQTVEVNSFLLLLLLLSLPPPLPTACCCSALICLWLCYLACSAARNKLTASVWVFVHTRAHVWVFRLAFVLVYEQTSRQQAEAATAEQQAGKQLGRFQFDFDCGRVRLSASLRRANRVPLKAHQAQLLLQDASKREKA